MRELQCATRVQIWKRPPSIGKNDRECSPCVDPVEWAEHLPQVEMGERLAKWRISMSEVETGRQLSLTNNVGNCFQGKARSC